MIPSRRWSALAPGVVLAVLGACGGGDAAPRDTALDRDLTLLAADSSAALPLTDSLTLGDTAVASRTPPAPLESPAPERVAARRAPATAARVPQVVAQRSEPAPVAPSAAVPAPTPAAEPAREDAARPALARGTLLAGTTGVRLCSTTNRPGDRLVATLTADVTGPDGLRLPAGTGMVLEVARIGPEGQVELMARGVSLHGTFHPIVADVTVGSSATERQKVGGTTSSKGKAVQGAIGGAVVGQVLGRDRRSTATGAAAGAVIGALAGQRGRRSEVCLPAGAPVEVRLADALTVRGAND